MFENVMIQRMGVEGGEREEREEDRETVLRCRRGKTERKKKRGRGRRLCGEALRKREVRAEDVEKDEEN